jgi:hypothetical protein
MIEGLLYCALHLPNMLSLYPTVRYKPQAKTNNITCPPSTTPEHTSLFVSFSNQDIRIVFRRSETLLPLHPDTIQ